MASPAVLTNALLGGLIARSMRRTFLWANCVPAGRSSETFEAITFRIPANAVLRTILFACRCHTVRSCPSLVTFAFRTRATAVGATVTCTSVVRAVLPRVPQLARADSGCSTASSFVRALVGADWRFTMLSGEPRRTITLTIDTNSLAVISIAVVLAHLQLTFGTRPVVVARAAATDPIYNRARITVVATVARDLLACRALETRITVALAPKAFAVAVAVVEALAQLTAHARTHEIVTVRSWAAVADGLSLAHR